MTVECDVYHCHAIADHFYPPTGVQACHEHAKLFDRTSWPEILELRQFASRQVFDGFWAGAESDTIAGGPVEEEFEGYYVFGDSGVDKNAWASLYTVGKPFGFGKYQWQMKFKGIGTYRGFIVGFERKHGFSNYGIAALFRNVSGSYFSETSIDGTLEDQTFTASWENVWNTVTLSWQANGVRFECSAGSINKLHVTEVPQSPMAFFIQLYTGTQAPMNEFGIKLKNFKRLQGGL